MTCCCSSIGDSAGMTNVSSHFCVVAGVGGGGCSGCWWWRMCTVSNGPLPSGIWRWPRLLMKLVSSRLCVRRWKNLFLYFEAFD